MFHLCKLHLANVAVNCRRPLLNSVMFDVWYIDTFMNHFSSRLCQRYRISVIYKWLLISAAIHPLFLEISTTKTCGSFSKATRSKPNNSYLRIMGSLWQKEGLHGVMVFTANVKFWPFYDKRLTSFHELYQNIVFAGYYQVTSLLIRWVSLETNLFIAYENDKQFVRPQKFATNSFHSCGNFCTT